MTKAERMELSILLKKKYSFHSIAEAMQRSVSTISREVQRNSVKGEYVPEKAHQKATLRWKYRKPYMKKIRQYNGLEEYIRAKLREDWSPETISQRWNTQERKEGDPEISHTTIYAYIDSSFGHGLEKHLYSCGEM